MTGPSSFDLAPKAMGEPLEALSRIETRSDLHLLEGYVSEMRVRWGRDNLFSRAHLNGYPALWSIPPSPPTKHKYLGSIYPKLFSKTSVFEESRELHREIIIEGRREGKGSWCI